MFVVRLKDQLFTLTPSPPFVPSSLSKYPFFHFKTNLKLNSKMNKKTFSIKQLCYISPILSEQKQLQMLSGTKDRH